MQCRMKSFHTELHMRFDLKKVFHKTDPLLALSKSVAVVLSFVLGSLLTGRIHEASSLLGAMLASVSSLVVLQADVKTSVRMGWLRILGTFIGVIIAYIYLIFFPFSIGGMAVAVFLLSQLCMWVGIPDDGRIATMTLVMIMIISKTSPELSPLTNGTLRFGEATIGSFIGIGLAWVLVKIKAVRDGGRKDKGSENKNGTGNSNSRPAK